MIYATFEIIDGIVHTRYDPELKIMTLDIAKEIVSSRISLLGNKLYPIIIHSEGIIEMTKEAREYYATSASYAGVSACGIVYSSWLEYAIAQVLLKFHSFPFPVKCFRNTKQATMWIKRQL